MPVVPYNQYFSDNGPTASSNLPPGTLPPMGPQGPNSAALNAWLAGLAKQKATQPQAPASTDFNQLLGLLGSGAPAASGIDPGLVGSIHSSFDDQVKTINQLYDQQLAHLDQMHANGVAGVNQNATDLIGRLHALGADALARQAGVNSGIAQGFTQAKGATSADAASLLHDLATHGAGTAGLTAELQGAKTMMGNEQNLQLADSRGQQGLLQQMLNDRMAEGQSIRTGALNDMLSQLETAKYNAGQARTSQLGAAQTALDKEMLSLRTASARSSARANKPMSPSELLDVSKLFGPAAAVAPNVATYFRTKDIRGDALLTPIANHYETAIASGQMTPDQAMADWQQNHGQYLAKGGSKANAQFVTNAIASAQADYSRATRTQKSSGTFDPAALVKYLALRSAGV